MDHNNVREKMLIFLHNPRTGGTTLSTTIEQLFPARAVFPGTLAIRLNSRTIRILWGGLKTPQQIIDSLERTSEKDKREIAYLHGHLPFGVHTMLPQVCTYVTILRNPVVRIISLYHFLRRRPDMVWYDQLQEVNLRGFVDDMDACGCHNGQVRRISGVGPETPLTANTLDRAKENLTEYFTIAGVTERLNEILLLLAEQRGWNWQDILYSRRNVGNYNRSRGDVSSDVIALIRNRNQLDIALYQFARQRIEQAVQEQGDPFQDRLRAFENQLVIYQSHPRRRAWNLIRHLAIDLHIQLQYGMRQFGSMFTS